VEMIAATSVPDHLLEDAELQIGQLELVWTVRRSAGRDVILSVNSADGQRCYERKVFAADPYTGRIFRDDLCPAIVDAYGYKPRHPDADVW